MYIWYVIHDDLALVIGLHMEYGDYVTDVCATWEVSTVFLRRTYVMYGYTKILSKLTKILLNRIRYCR